MKVVIDAMSGDNAPKAMVEGALLAVKHFDHQIVLTGDTDTIKKCVSELGHDPENPGFEIVHTTQTIAMDENPFNIKNKKDSSMRRALDMLAEGKVDACVSAGSTGALYSGAVLFVSRLKGVKKAAIASVIPFENPVLLLDSGANVIIDSEHLEVFALMGSAYMKDVLGVENPRVGLLNNGTEPTKGSQTLRDTYQRLSNRTDINFVGNVEAKTLPFGACDVLVTDGFSGNLVLKLTEGLGAFFMKKLKGVYKKNVITLASAAMVKKELSQMKKDFDASEHGGAPLLGISKPVIKAHGSSDAKAIMNAVRAAAIYAETGVADKIEKTLNSAKE